MRDAEGEGEGGRRNKSPEYFAFLVLSLFSSKHDK